MEAHHAQATATLESACFGTNAVSETRKLAAILVADIVGYSRLAGADEDRILARLRTLRSDLIDPILAVHHGRVVKRTGDGAIVEFRSVVDAVRCAVELQNGLIERNAGVPEDRRIEFRVGIHVGDVVEEADGDLMGDGVNIAARLEGISKPGAICLSEQAYWQVKGRLDLKVADLGKAQLKNIAEPIHVYSLEVGQPLQEKPSPSASADQKPVPPRLSLVVLPFANIGGDPEQEHFVDGVTESLTTDLSRMRGAFVIGRNTAFTYKGKAVDLKQIGRELNVRYVLEGSVQRGGNRMRVNVQLIDAETGNHLWAERFDKPLTDLFDMQDEIVARLAGALNAELVAAEARRAERAPTPDSMDLYFQGQAWLNKGRTPDNAAQARSFFDRALTADPDNVEALVGSARVDELQGALSFVTDPAAAFAAAEAKLSKALSSVPDHARGHAMLGSVYIWTKRAEEGIAECEHALALDRNLAPAHTVIGLGKMFVGCAEETEAHVAEALRLSPRDPLAHNSMMIAGIAKVRLGSWEQAVAWCRRAIEANRNNPLIYFTLAVALAQLGRLDEAHSAVKVGLVLNPTFTVSRARTTYVPVSDDPTYLAQTEAVLEGMRKAGIPEQ
jgi:TolB-like protein/class 3 adenylate cyclase/Tfp pilus assembly protein PilF